MNDLNATVLQCLGIDHERFTYRYLGLDQRLTGVEHPKVISNCLPRPDLFRREKQSEFTSPTLFSLTHSVESMKRKCDSIGG